MVEVFKTNVRTKSQAQSVIKAIQWAFENYKVNFDLEDCDKILRVENPSGFVEPLSIIQIVEKFGYKGGVLPEEYFTFDVLLPEHFLKQP
jgi:hypothetical protein